MNDEYTWWFLVVGLCVGGALVWLVRGQMAREEEDVAEAERGPEARWISRTIERAGGIAPADLVAQVLALHRGYLRDADPFEAGLEMDAPDEATGDLAADTDEGRDDELAADDDEASDDGGADVGPDSESARLIWLERASPAADDDSYPGDGSSPADQPPPVETGRSRQGPASDSGT
jgi:hypothetical protein